MTGRPPEPDDEREPAPDADDIDVRFADIAASLGDLTVPPAERAEDASEHSGGKPGADVARVHEGPATGPGPRDYALAPSGPGEAESPGPPDDEPGYVPPEPAPLTSTEPLLGLAWTGVLVPVGLVIVYLVLWRAMPEILLALAGVVFVLSVALLIWRMPARRDADDHDDGAVV